MVGDQAPRRGIELAPHWRQPDAMHGPWGAVAATTAAVYFVSDARVRAPTMIINTIWVS